MVRLRVLRNKRPMGNREGDQPRGERDNEVTCDYSYHECATAAT